MTVAPTTENAHPAGEERVGEAMAGDEAAFAEIYGVYAAKVYNLVLRSTRDPLLAEDICQEVWLKVHRELPALREPAAFRTWLYRLAGRLCIDAARKRKRSVPAEQLGDDLAAEGGDPESSAIQEELGRLVWQALASLPARQHLALFLKDVEGQSYREIADVLDTTESAVETLLYRARHGLVGAYERLTSTPGARCSQAKKIMASLLDGEGTAVYQRAAQAHGEECLPCRSQLVQLRRASAIYAGIHLLPVPASLLQRALDTGSLATAATSSSGGVALVTLAGTKVKSAAVTLLIATSIGGAALVAPAHGVGEPPASPAAQVADTVVPDHATVAEGEPPATRPTVAPAGVPAEPPLDQTTLDLPDPLPISIEGVTALEIDGIPSVQIPGMLAVEIEGIPSLDLQDTSTIEPLAPLVGELDEAVGEAGDAIEDIGDEIDTVLDGGLPATW